MHVDAGHGLGVAFCELAGEFLGLLPKGIKRWLRG
jgi:hypothetical protein